LGTQDKLIAQILSGKHDASFRFAEIDNLLSALGFSQRVKGDHHIYYKDNIVEILNLQPVKSRAKAYQVKQIRELIVKYKLEVK
jgi:predicted RNA binding protein YcfA (HicA-like mRNA interferase family)